MTWKHTSSPVTKKFKIQQSDTKVMATVFWDSRGIILLDILPKGESVNADRYCETLDRLSHAVRRKRPGLLHDNTHHPVARQCCEIMGPSLCRSCRRLESRAQNRKSAELECPRMRSAGGRGRQTFSLTQVIKRSYPRLSDAEIQDKLARGEIARLSFPWNSRNDRYDEDDIDDDNNITNINYLSSGRSSTADKGQDSYDDDDDDDDNIDDEEDKDILHVDPGTYRANSNTPSTRPDSGTVNCDSEGNISNKADNTNNSVRSTSSTRQHLTKASLDSKNAFYFLARLTMKLRGATSTPLFFSDLRSMQSKILSGTVDRKAYMTLRPDMERSRQTQQGQPSRLKSAVSSTSTSSGKSGLSKFGSQLSREFMPAFVSPRKIKLLEEPKYKVFFEPPLLTKRRQIPNPSFFAGSNDEYSLPERLPDVIEFADSQRIAALEKQIRSGSALSFVSSMSDEQQQQLLQSSLGEQDKLTSLPLDKGDDSGIPDGAVGENRPASAKGGVREGGVSTPTPRSLLRVSSGGPLSSRTVPEENEEEVRRELEADEQVEQEEPMRKDEDKLETNKNKTELVNLLREENIENTSNVASENVSNSDSNVENREPFENKTIAEEREKEETGRQGSGEVKDVLEEDNIQELGSLSLNHEVSQKEIESSSRICEESDPAVDEVSVQHQPSKELESDYTCIKENIQEVDKSGDAILEESGSHGTQCSPFFLTNREQSGQFGSLKDSGRETAAKGNNSDNDDEDMYNGPGNIDNSDNVNEDDDDNDDQTRDDEDDNGHISYADRESP
ncbi:histone-lysine N-methyltransferase SETMAR [Plakobranchus ocellatus]|uniref:Histone-lysine N-methyltransferase SETMAR n=1 Tax=Plakobranchus ocellatus TaxID=259542 RepID=A0AAV3Y2Q9_9GAST|nr:histone-lysine N-methyltransferase SETMAR [Plakobranchus ocellatus]